MDCEDKKSDSYTTGNVGASYVENGNVNFVFCLTNANRYYPGGVLLVDHIDYNLTLTQDSRREVRKWMLLFVTMTQKIVILVTEYILKMLIIKAI